MRVEALDGLRVAKVWLSKAKQLPPTTLTTETEVSFGLGAFP